MKDTSNKAEDTIDKAEGTSTPKSVIGNRLGKEMITLFVGPNREELTIHKQVICRLPFFNKAFKGNFKEANGKMDLPEETPDAMYLFVDWLYRGIVQAIKSKAHLNNLYSFYMFAEKICEERLMNMIIDAIQDVSLACDVYIDGAQVLHICQNSPNESHLRRFALGLYVQGLAHSLNASEDMEVHRLTIAEAQEYMKQDEDMGIDVVYRAMKLGAANNDIDYRKRGVQMGGRCQFHRHPKNIVCHLSMTHEEVVADVEFKQFWTKRIGKLWFVWAKGVRSRRVGK